MQDSYIPLVLPRIRTISRVICAGGSPLGALYMLSLHAGRLPSAASLVPPDGYRCYESTEREEFRSRGTKQWLQWQEAPVI